MQISPLRLCGTDSAGEQRRFEYRVVRATIPVDFEQKLANMVTQGFATVPGTFQIGADGITAIVESTGEPVKPVKYTLQARANGVLAQAKPMEIIGCATSTDGLWYLLADAVARGEGQRTKQVAAPPIARRLRRVRRQLAAKWQPARRAG